MLQYSCCAPGTPALPVLALTDDIVSTRFRRIDKFCQCGCLKNARKQDEVTVTVGGRTLTLTPEQEQTVRAWAGRA